MGTRRFGAFAWAAPFALSTALAVGCVGGIGGDDDVNGPGSGPSCDGSAKHGAARPLRRLTPSQYENTVRDLFGDPAFVGDLPAGGEIITESEVRQLRDAAERIATRQALWTKPVFPCDISGAGSDACVDQFLDGFAARAFRRPLSSAERTSLRAVYDDARAASMTFRESMEMLLEVVLQSPAFVYMFEAGEGDAPTRLLSDYEVASRLSYFLWDTMPDDALLAAASQGELTQPEGLKSQAQRLLDDPRAEKAVQRFMSSWLQLDGGVLHNALEEVEKDPTFYPEFDAALRDAMRTETEAFVRRAFFEEQGSLEDLLSARYAYVNGPLAALYGVPGPADAATWQWVELDPSQRAGILTRGAFLTVLSTKNVTAPIRRGVWVLEELMCTELGEPPANANNVAVDGGVVDGQLRTVRDDVTQRTTTSEPCTGCHTTINPIGFTFENYDAIGRYQTEEVTSGLPIDASGTIATSGDVDGPVANALELSSRLASSAKVQRCFAGRWYRAAIGSDLSESDQCALAAIEQEFEQGGSMRDLVLAVIESDAFRYLNVSEMQK